MGTRQGVVAGIVAAALGVLVAQPLAGTAAILPQHTAAPPLPHLTVPTASVPSATVPAVSTPVGTTPPVTTPRATTPSTTTPSLSIPSDTTPPVSTPPGTVPSATAPSVSAPSGTAPVRTTASKVSALVGGATRSAQVSGAPGVPASAAPDRAGAASARTGGGAGALPAAASGSAATRATTGVAGVAGVARDARSALARGRDGAPRRGSARARRLAATRESRRLRRLVARLHGCLGTLGVGARRLLTLRAGLYRPARSAAATARILRVSAGREAGLERLALVALRRSAGTGCAGPATVVARAFASAGTLSPSAPQLGAGTPASGPAASLSAAHAERPPQNGRAAGTLPPPRGGAVERAETGSSSFPGVLVPALLALLLALALLALPETRRRLRPAPAVPSPDTPREPAHTLPPAAPIAYSATARRPRSAAPGTQAKRTGMDDAMAQMAADVFAEMARDTPGPAPHPQPEGYLPYPHVEVEGELLPAQAAPPAHPAPRAQRWAHEHATQAALVGTVVLGWLARLTRRGRRRRRSG